MGKANNTIKEAKNTIKNQMKIIEILRPVYKELMLVEKELKNAAQDLHSNYGYESISNFFELPGERIHPALLLLSARSVNRRFSSKVDHLLIQLAAAMELIHTAVLIHNNLTECNIVINDRNSLNRTLSNKIAVLIGDMLYTQAFLTALTEFPKEFFQQIAQLTEIMCLSEIEQVRDDNAFSTRERYYKILRDKTALFMGTCCRLGAILAGAKDNEVYMMDQYGMKFGMAYQMMNWYVSRHYSAVNYAGIKEAKEFAVQARFAIRDLEDTVYKDSLIGLPDFVINTFME